MLKLDIIDAVAGRMVTSMYTVLKHEHDRAMNDGLTEQAADEAVREAIINIHHALKEADETVYHDTEY